MEDKVVISRERLGELLLAEKYWDFQHKEDGYYGVRGMADYLDAIFGTNYLDKFLEDDISLWKEFNTRLEEIKQLLIKEELKNE